MKLLILLLISVSGFSQTRFYQNTDQIPGNTPTVNAAWNNVSGNVIRMMKPVKDGSTVAEKTSGTTGAVAIRKVLLRQFISEPLAAQTFTSQTITGQMRWRISNATGNTGQVFAYFRILNPNGSVATEIGTMTSTDLTVTSTNRTFIALTFTQVITAGQRLCVDVGWNYSVGTTTTIQSSGVSGSGSGTDLPVNNTTTSANNAWFEISQTVIFQKPYKFFF